MTLRNPCELDIHEAKLEMKLAVFRLWLYVVLLWAYVLLAMSFGFLGADLKVERDSFLTLWMIGGVFAFIPVFFIGMRRWFSSDARRIWQQPDLVVAAVLRSTAGTSQKLNNDKTFSPRMYWLAAWATYWKAREIAVADLGKTGKLAGTPQYLSGLGDTTVAVSSSDADEFMHRPRKWYELVIATIGVFVFIGAFCAIALRL